MQNRAESFVAYFCGTGTQLIVFVLYAGVATYLIRSCVCVCVCVCVLYGRGEVDKPREICHNTAVPTTNTAWI